MRAAGFVVGIATLFGFLSLGACSEQEVVAQLRSLSGSEDAVFICVDDNGVGHPYADCPDPDATDDQIKAKHLKIEALVSQTLTDEVAVVNVTDGGVVDVDPRTPGFGFLPVGGRPVSMAATPGGTTTFVATADVGHNGIFALSTGCLGAPKDNVRRDLTSWSSCRLPEAPGEIAVVVQPFDDAQDPSAECDLKPYLVEDVPPELCRDNLLVDGGAEGRRKLVVALPDSGSLAVIDAQNVLKNAPGAFPDCVIEKRIQLKVDVPAGVTQTLPPDLQTSCNEFVAPTPPPPPPRAPQPAGFALADDKLYVADQAAPVIHVLDLTNVCGDPELPSLLPMSLREPERVVTTRRVAVSPLTPAGKRYVYAIDAEDQPGASVMIFDVSPGSTDPTPLVRPGSPELLGEKPDRLALTSSAKDVTFAYRDIPYVDPTTGVAEFGKRCDPVTADASSQGALARPNPDMTLGARPGLLRGLFGFILQSNGAIAIVDVDDFDADCRRPVTPNTNPSVPDFRGCVADAEPLLDTYVDANGDPTVSNEVSCRVVEPHRFRSARPARNDSQVGVHAPSLRSFPQLSLPASTSSSIPEDRPRLLGVPFADVDGNPATTDVFVGATRYSTETDSANKLPVDPNLHTSDLLASLNSVVLPPFEPRAYPADDTVTLTYEGSFAGERSAGFLSSGGGGKVELADSSLSFCNAGVFDVSTMGDFATSELGLSAEDAATFAGDHSDFVQLITDFPPATDSYWSKVQVARADCAEKFGDPAVEPLKASRDLYVVSAFADKLVLVPDATGGAVWHGAADEADLEKCFPTVQKYRLRAGRQWVLVHSASGFRHDVFEGAGRACVRSCNPLRKWDKGRVFEISAANDNCREADATEGDPRDLRVGCAGTDVACVYNQPTLAHADSGSAISLADPAAKCIFNGLTDRFAVYRGRAPSLRGSVFTWQTTGGFVPLSMSLANLSSVVSPQSILYLQHPEQMAVVDGASQGLSLFSLDTFTIVKPSPFY